ncbi:MAG: NAD kinase [Candidatus Thorarchaeota archaeon]|nr:MAG: NAD kinase [Candidatus Thorarchaeota archaeon]
MKIFVTSDSESSVLDDAKQILKILEDSGADVNIDEDISQFLDRQGTPLKKVKANLLIVIGSDKTLLNTLLKLGDKEIPILPVASKGQPDFLFDITISDFDQIMEDILSRKWKEDHRSRLVVNITGKNGPPILNDIGIFAKKSATLMRYSLYLDGEQFLKDGSDGILVATPTGSTAYSMSVGGPVILSPASVVSILPVNSINPATRAVVVSEDTEIEIRDISCSVSVEAIFDGQLRKKVSSGPISIRKADTDAVFVQFSRERIANLRGKLLRKTEEFEDLAQDLPPSAKLVLKVLEYEGPLTQKEIIAESILPPRTVRYALSILISEGLVSKKISLRDSRQGIYRVNEGKTKE